MSEIIKPFLIKHKKGLLILAILFFLNKILGIISTVFWLICQAIAASLEKSHAEQQAKNQIIIDELNADGLILDLFFVKASSYRQKDPELTHKSDCKLKITPEKFFIIQDNKQIENNTQSIRQISFWNYDGDDYCKIQMKSHTEYMFGVNDEQYHTIVIAGRALNIDIHEDTSHLDAD